MSARINTGHVVLPEGGQIAYQSAGDDHGGTPVLLIRPLGGSMALWGAFRDRLAETFRVVSFDLRGTGQSSSELGWMSTRDIANDSIRVLDHLGIERAHVFGISLGGMAATWFAILAPDRIERLCIASAPACGFELTRAWVSKQMSLAACFLKPRDEVEAGLVDRILSHEFREAHALETRLIEEKIRASAAPRRTLLAHALAGLVHHAHAELQCIRAPTLVLAGDHDSLLGEQPCRELAKDIPHASFEIVRESGHDLTLEQPLVTAERVADFFHDRPERAN